MIAKVNTDTYIDIDAINYIEVMTDDDDEIAGIQLMLNGSPLTFHDTTVAQRIIDSYVWQHQVSIYNMIEDTEGYRKKLMI